MAGIASLCYTAILLGPPVKRKYTEFVPASSSKAALSTAPEVKRTALCRETEASVGYLRQSESASSKALTGYHHLDWTDPLAKFVVVRLDWEPAEHPCNVLNRSSTFCKVSCTWDYAQQDHMEKHTCSVFIDGFKVSESSQESKAAARDAAASSALDVLKSRCFTLAIKNKYLSDGTLVDPSALNPDTCSTNQQNTTPSPANNAIASSNVGHKLLKLMGWSGGGLGKEKSGTVEPIITQSASEYISSGNPYDLVFTSGFDNDQRKDIHMIARKLGLKSKSYGKDDDRFVTVSRKRTGREIIQMLLQQGGSDEKYILIPPAP